VALLNSFAQTGALATTPWTRREDGGIYVGENRSVWLYRELLLAPLRWEDPQRRLESGSDLEGLLTAIGEKSRDLGQGVAFLSRKRVVHIVMVNYETACVTPAGTPEDLGDFMDQVLPSTMASQGAAGRRAAPVVPDAWVHAQQRRPAGASQGDAQTSKQRR